MLEPIQQIFQFLSGRCDHAKPFSCRNARPVDRRCLVLAASLLMGVSLATNPAVPAIANEQVKESNGPGAFDSGLVPTANSAVAAGDKKAETSSLMTFDLPVQPLVSALETYGAVSGWQVVYDGALARGRQSAAVKGRFASALLDSTGDPNFDATLERAIRSISIGAPPPAGFAQPVILVITPDVTRDCRATPDGMQRANAEP
jgi:hypothetical protein